MKSVDAEGAAPARRHPADRPRARHRASTRAAHIVTVVRHERDAVAGGQSRADAGGRRSSTRTTSPAPAARSRSRSPRCRATSTATSSWSAATCRCSTPTPSRAHRRAPRRPHAAATVLSAPSSTTPPATAASCATPTAASTASSSRRTPTPTSWPSPRSTPAPTCSPPRALREQLPRVGTDNAQGEKYLTDVVGLLRAAGSIVAAMPGRRELDGRRRQRPGAAGRARPRG